MPPTPVPRPTARILLVDDAERVLLFSAPLTADPARTGWFTPGGGVRDGETLAQAALRELAEETGHVVAPDQLGPVVALSSGTWSAGDTVYLATNSFFFVRAGHPGVDTSGQETLERSVITGHRWWTLADLQAATDPVFPVGLAGLVDQLLTTGVPAMPVRLPWDSDG